jgi:hypothetical protein
VTATRGARGAPARAGPVAGALLAALYALTAAPALTFWDAGEFVAAFATFGVPHPPGTPLFVALGRTWTLALGALGVGAAPAAALLSAACTAGAGGVTAALVARWTGSARAGVAAALTAGTMSTVWASATEPEVYAPALLLALLAVLAADAAGRGTGSNVVRGTGHDGGGGRGAAAAVYALGLAGALHLSALVAAPVAVLLAARGPGGLRRARRPVRRWRALVMTSAAVLAAGMGAGRVRVAVVAGGLLGATIVILGFRPRPLPGAPHGAAREAAAALGAALLAATAILIMLVRARHDPWLNQAAPSSWAALGDVLARRQYAPAGPWPRQAPLWLQLANLGEWADWQVALGLDARVGPSGWRTPFTVAYAGLGVAGGAWHRRRDGRSFAAWALLLACGTIGVAGYLNLKAGPSFGVGVLPDAAPHEARERDYFFALGWWAWGAWAGLGAMVVSRRVAARLGRGRARGPRAMALGLALAALPAALNWRAADRRRDPAASTADAYARALLGAAPPRAVLVVRADNDTYPLWAAQARGLRRDVTVVTASLLPADWYRAELGRRHALLPAAAVRAWPGEAGALRALGEAAAAGGRPVATTLAVGPEVHAVVGGAWVHTGLLVERVPVAELDRRAPDAVPPALAGLVGVPWVDTTAVRRSAASVAALAPRVFGGAPPFADDGVGAWARRQLACPAALLAAWDRSAPAHGAPGASRVEGACRAR